MASPAAVLLQSNKADNDRSHQLIIGKKSDKSP